MTNVDANAAKAFNLLRGAVSLSLWAPSEEFTMIFVLNVGRPLFAAIGLAVALSGVSAALESPSLAAPAKANPTAVRPAAPDGKVVLPGAATLSIAPPNAAMGETYWSQNDGVVNLSANERQLVSRLILPIGNWTVTARFNAEL